MQIANVFLRAQNLFQVLQGELCQLRRVPGVQLHRGLPAGPGIDFTKLLFGRKFFG
jgi:hypothetical protein